jgi:hypothetical protein
VNGSRLTTPNVTHTLPEEKRSTGSIADAQVGIVIAG